MRSTWYLFFIDTANKKVEDILAILKNNITLDTYYCRSHVWQKTKII